LPKNREEATLAPVVEERPTSFQEYVALIEKYQATADRSLWYRGCGNVGHALLPSLYRHRTIKKPDEFAQLEQQLMLRFRQRSLPFVARPLGDDWETLFIMQHYGVPTRLLDWRILRRTLPVSDSGACWFGAHWIAFDFS
jgi:hypothetical protein